VVNLDKSVTGLIIVGLMVILQGVAWYFGKDGAITGLISLIIGGIAGSLFGFEIGIKKAKTN
jgi:uncharacterized membrane-anchored protein